MSGHVWRMPLTCFNFIYASDWLYVLNWWRRQFLFFSPLRPSVDEWMNQSINHKSTLVIFNGSGLCWMNQSNESIIEWMNLEWIINHRMNESNQSSNEWMNESWMNHHLGSIEDWIMNESFLIHYFHFACSYLCLANFVLFRPGDISRWAIATSLQRRQTTKKGNYIDDGNNTTQR